MLIRKREGCLCRENTRNLFKRLHSDLYDIYQIKLKSLRLIYIVNVYIFHLLLSLTYCDLRGGGY